MNLFNKFLERPFIVLTLIYACALIALDQTGRLRPAALPDCLNPPSSITHDISADISGIPEQKNGKLYFETSISQIDGKPASFKALAISRDTSLELHPLDTITITGTIYSLKEKPNPGAFNYARYIKRNGISAIINPYSISVTKTHPWRLETIAYRIRNDILDVIYNYLPDKEAGLLAPMLIGDQSALTQTEKSQFRDAGVAHILVVSGLNVAYCAVLFLWCFRICGLSRRKAALLSIPFIILYVFATGANPPVLRAGVMALFVILSLALNREPLIYQSLALAAAAILIVDPRSLFTASFQLSFAATIGIVYLYKYFILPFEKLPKWAKYIFGSVFAVTLSAQAAVLPLLVYYFNRVSIVGFVSNILIVPLSGFITAAGLVLYLLHFISPALTGIAAFANLYSVRLLSTLVQFSAGLPLATINAPSPSIPDTIVYYFVLWGIFRIKEYPKIKWIIACLLLGLGMLHGIARYKEINRTEIVFFNLPAGEATYIDFSGREKWLIDGGGSFTAGSDPGERIISPFLVSRGVRKLDKIIITRPKYAHYAGLKFIIEIFKVGEVIFNPEFSGEADFGRLLELIKQKNIPCREVWAGDSFIAAGSTVSVISPVTLSTNSADNSLVLMVKSYGNKVLLCSDMGARAEKRLTESKNIKCDAITLPDRSKRVLSKEFLNQTRPDYFIASTYIKDLPLPNTTLLSTAENGAVRIIIGQNKFVIGYFE